MRQHALERKPLAGPLSVSISLLSIVLAGFLVLPLLAIIPTSFTGEQFLGFPPRGLSLRWYEEVLGDPIWRGAFLRSLQYSLIAATIATVVGTAAALGVRRATRGRSWLRTLFIAPLVLPYIVYAFGLYTIADGMRAVGSAWPIVLGQASLAIPLVFVAVSAAAQRLDPRTERAAASLGATWYQTVVLIELPLLRLSIIGSAAFAFAFCFDEVVVALFLGGPETTTFPVQIFSTSREAVSPAIAAASSLATFAAFAFLGAVTAGLSRRSKKNR